jgi:predicted aspartyl protease
MFGAQGFSLIDVVSRSFLVFVAVVVLIIVGLMAALVIAERVKRTSERTEEQQNPARKDYTTVGKGPQTVTR